MMVYSICEETGLRVCELLPLLLVREDGFIKKINTHNKMRSLNKWTRGTLHNNYYVASLPITYIQCKVHRLVAISFLDKQDGKDIIDHIDGDRSNNKVNNLRWVDHRLNQQNRYTHRNGRLVGTSYHKPSKKWLSRLNLNKITYRMGSFNTELEAHQAYLNKIIELNIR